MPLRMHIETIPHQTQRYPTVGDYWEEDGGTEQVRVSELPDWRYEALVAVHEMVEMILAKHRNGPLDTVKLAYVGRYTRFDNLARPGA